MTPYQDATLVRERIVATDNGQLCIRLLRGERGDAGRSCIHRVQSDPAGRLQSDIVYFYDATVKAADIESDFDLLAGGGLISVGRLHHTESMLNRGRKMPRGW
jgi:hypothetical protein